MPHADDRRDVAWDELLARQPGRFETEALDPEHPLMLAYTSGTTGRPKGAVHVHGGFLVKIAAEVAYQTDLAPRRDPVLGERPRLDHGRRGRSSARAALGATVFLYEGAPNHPAPDRVWDMVERHRISHLGISPTLIRALIPAGEEHVRRHDLSSLRILGSTGEPWNPEPYLWFFREVGGGRCPIINISGGTEVGACFLSPLPITPLKPTTVRRPGARAWRSTCGGPTATPVPRGEVGELVCTKPWPCMTRGVWGDPERYLEAYWSRWPDVWVHGDWATIDADGFWFLHGRSDDTMNVAGKRLGPAEVESRPDRTPGRRRVGRGRHPPRREGRERVVLRGRRSPAGSATTTSRSSSGRRLPSSSGSRSGPTGSCSSTSCRGRVRPRSCAGRSGRPFCTPTRATCPAWRTPPPSRASATAWTRPDSFEAMETAVTPDPSTGTLRMRCGSPAAATATAIRGIGSIGRSPACQRSSTSSVFRRWVVR